MHVALTIKSGNRKVGPIPVSTTEEGSCPTSCPLQGTDCYARFGPLGMHWRKIMEGGRGTKWTLFCRAVAAFATGQIWRHNQAGDLPKLEVPADYDGPDRIDAELAFELSKASEHTNGWTYTHYDPTDSFNASVIQEMNDVPGLTVNLSADSLVEADEYAALNIAPVTVILPKDAPLLGNKTPGGLPVVVCPAQNEAADVSCDQCPLCRKRDRKSIVGFLAHGTAKKRLSQKLEDNLVSL